MPLNAYNNRIVQTPVCGQVIDTFFDNIRYRGSLDGDLSFISTLRALLRTRLHDGEEFDYNFSKNGNYYNTMSRVSDSDYIKSMYRNSGLTVDETVPNGLYVVSAAGYSAQDDEAILNRVRSVMSSDLWKSKGFERVDKVHDFFKREFAVECFINEAKHVSFLFTSALSFQKYHFLQVAIPVVLPWFFQHGTDNAATDEDKALLRTIADTRDTAKYLEMLEKSIADIPIREATIRQLLGGFETRQERYAISNLENQIRAIQRDIDSWYDSITSSYRTIDDYNSRLLGYMERKKQKENGDSEIMQYFLLNKNIDLEQVSDTSVRFVVRSHLDGVPEDVVNNLLEYSRSPAFAPNGRDCGNIIPHDDMKMFLKAALVEKKIKLRFCAIYEMDLSGGLVGMGSNYNYPPSCATYMPNTHIDAFSCLGGYRDAVLQYVRSGDYISAIEQCVISCQSLNFEESPTVCEFFRRVYGISDYDNRNNIRFVELPDGSCHTVKEAIEWLKENQNEEEDHE